jgi:sulfur-oxidizing protein SoxZ
MAGEARVQAPGEVAKGEVFQVRTLISHPMETGLRHDGSGKPIPRRIINRFSCRYDDTEVFSTDLHEAMAASPYLAFFVRADHTGTLHFLWEEDGGATFTLEKPLTITA